MTPESAEALGALAAVVGERYVVTHPDETAPYLNDWRGRYRGTALAVVKPATTAEVAAVMALSTLHNLAVCAQGGNTGLCGGAAADMGQHGIIMSLSRLQRIRSIDVVNRSLIAEAGCILDQLAVAVAEVGCELPIDLASSGSCQLGGLIATNAGGLHVVRHGTMRRLTLGLEVVLADGRVVSMLNTLKKRNTGYDLKQLFIGSEGTLGIITAAAVALAPAPEQRFCAWLGFDSLDAAVATMQAIDAAFPGSLSAFEVMARPVLDLLTAEAMAESLPQPLLPWSVLCECILPAAPVGAVVADAMADWLVSCQHPPKSAHLATSGRDAERFWQLRERLPEAQKRLGLSFKHDISLPISSLTAAVAAVEVALKSHFPDAICWIFGHLGDGSLHLNVYPGQIAADKIAWQQQEVADLVHNLVHAHGGAFSAEHGVGRLKVNELHRYCDAVEYDLMIGIKHLLDPLNRLNRGALFK